MNFIYFISNIKASFPILESLYILLLFKSVTSIIDFAFVNSFKARITVLIFNPVISAISVDDGPILKRIKHRSKGRADHILKRMCHVTVKVSDEKREDKS